MQPFIYMNLLEKLLNHYDLSLEEYEYLSRPIENVKLIDPNSIGVMARIKERIFKAIERKEKIIIYGDYDCDGISATTIMVKTFELLNYPVSYYIPSRYLDGYGLNVTNTEKIADKGFNLIIAVDNGVSAFEAIDLANEKGIDVIVVDHHELPEKDVNAYAILHPIHSKVNEVVASAGHMALYLSSALLNRYEPYLVTIAGLSVISDLMELKDYNRDVTRLAIEYLKKYRFEALTNLMDNEQINELTLGLDIAPKINAVGRLVTDTSINRLVKYLTTDNTFERSSLLSWIIKLNDERKELTKAASEKIDEEIDTTEAGIVAISDMKEGLIGLIANRLLSLHNKPTCLFTYENDNKEILKGSMRSKNGFNVIDIINMNQDILLSGGGHSSAGGVSINIKDFPLFKQRFNEYASTHPLVDETKGEIELSLNEITMENYEIVNSFSPFGMGFKEPEFVVKHISTRSLQFISFGKHISEPLSMNTRLLGFNMPSYEVQEHQYIDIYGKFYLNIYRGRKTLEYRITKYKESE